MSKRPHRFKQNRETQTFSSLSLGHFYAKARRVWLLLIRRSTFLTKMPDANFKFSLRLLLLLPPPLIW